MGFFYTDDGLVHGGRIVGIFSVIALVLGCGWLDRFDQLCVMRAIFTAGWALAFCDKRMARTFPELMTSPARLGGTVLAVLGIVGQSYVLWAHRGAHG